MSLYKLKGVRKVFDKCEALNIPEMSIDKGKIYGLLGANGTGKTTLLNLLAFLETPSEGVLFFNSSKVS